MSSRLSTLAWPIVAIGLAGAALGQVKISQIYGGGTFGGAAGYNADFIELYNAGAEQFLGDWAVQIAGSATSTTWTRIDLPAVNMPANSYFLIRLQTPGATGRELPTPDHTGTATAMTSSAGKGALTSTQTTISGTGCGWSDLIDLVSYTTSATPTGCYEGPVGNAVISSGAVNSAQRKCGGSLDGDDNRNDFNNLVAEARNSASPYTGGNEVSLTAALNPNSGPNGTVALVTARALTCTPATDVAFTADLSAVGGGGADPLNDDGNNGDVTAGDGVYSREFTVSAGAGTAVVNVAYNDGQFRSANMNVNFVVSAPLFDLKVSQVYGGGGSGGASQPNVDYVEIYNAGGVAADLSGYSVQAASETGTAWTVYNLAGSVAANGYYLVQLGNAGATGTSIPTPDASSTTASPLVSTGGKVAIVASQVALSGACPIPTSAVVDFVGYEAANCFEGGGPATPGITATNALRRRCGGGTDTDNNNADFVLADANEIRNSGSPINGGMEVDAAASPASVQADATVRITAAVTGCLGSLSNIAVTVDLGNIGGTPSAVMFDDGSNGDQNPGDGTYTLDYLVPGNTPQGATSVTVNATADGGLSGGDILNLNILAAASGACCTNGNCSIAIRVDCENGGGTWLGANTICGALQGFDSTDAFPISIPDPSGGVPGEGVATISVSDTTTITDLTVIFDMAHTWIGDLRATISNGVTEVTLFYDVGDAVGTGVGDSSNLNGVYRFNDAGQSIWTAALAGDSTFNIPGGTYHPSGPLSDALPSPSLAAFNGQSLAGTWTLRITDNQGADLGSIRSFRIENVDGSVDVCAGAGCPGGDACDVADINGDCQVGLTDLAILLANFGLGPVPPQAFENGDLTGDQAVDLTDLATLLGIFGTNCN